MIIFWLNFEKKIKGSLCNKIFIIRTYSSYNEVIILFYLGQYDLFENRDNGN